MSDDIVLGSRWQAEYRMRCHLEPAVGGSDLAKMASRAPPPPASIAGGKKIYNLGTKTGLKLKLIRNPSELIPVAVIGWLAAPPG